MFYAHSGRQDDFADWQCLPVHLRNVADGAAARAARFGALRAARLAGLLHDIGKYSPVFQARIQGATIAVDHATAGAKLLLEAFAGKTWSADTLLAEILAYAIAGHHTGLPDRQGSGAALTQRVGGDLPPLDPRWREEIAFEATDLMPEGFVFEKDPKTRGFQAAMLGRFLFSCLVDADYRDTEAFYAALDGRTVDREWPALPAIVDDLLAALDAHLVAKSVDPGNADLNGLRRAILAHARARAAEPPGAFTLTVPTGGGKTLTSLAFALAHAKAHKLERIVYVAPYTAIIDQTAAIFRTILGDVVLEHHSGLEETEFRAREGADKLRLAMEDWAAPVVVTTSVQLFESLFAARPSRCRKLHALAGSVIVLDEAQVLPHHVLRPCVAALVELTRNYGASVVLCTATQPALLAPDFKGGFPADRVRELAPEPETLASKLGRTTLVDAGALSDADLVAALAESPQGLVIVNSRAHALALFDAARAAGLEGVVHLTTRQYGAHRRAILARVAAELKAGRPCRVIATALVEAGVDLDFPRVWRARAGLDQIAQAAGRCNREGKRPRAESIVTVFDAPEHKAPAEIAQRAADFSRVAARFRDDPLSLAAIEDYFKDVYWTKDAGRISGLDRDAVMEQFAFDPSGTDFAYRTVAEKFRLIENALVPIVIARDAPARDALAVPERPAGALARALQPYVVAVPPKDRARLIATCDVRLHRPDLFGDQFAVLVNDELYREETGLAWEGGEDEYVSMV